MICPHCHHDTGRKISQFCPNCGSLLGISQSGEPDPAPIETSIGAQKQAMFPVAPNASPGPLITGQVSMDVCLGFMGEIVAFALLIYGFLQLVIGTKGNVSPLEGLMCIITSFFIYWYTYKMRGRYPKFSKGWETGRNTWGKGVDHLLTLLFGVAILVVLFPLGGLLICVGMTYGPIAWIGALAVAYVFGILGRQMANNNKRRGGNLP